MKRLGRYTLSGDDLAQQGSRALDGGGGPLRLVALAVRDGASRMNLFDGEKAMKALRLILGGTRPTAVRDFERLLRHE